MCANMDVSLVQQEIPVSKNAIIWKRFKPQWWPEVASGNSGHKHKTKNGKTIGLNDKKPGFSSGFFY